MAPTVRNLFELPRVRPTKELFEAWLPDHGVLIERIISTGQTTAPAVWLEQDRDEWVALLAGAAVLSFADGQRVNLRPGDALLIRAGERHRVEHTSSTPPCVWLAVHGRLAP